MNTERNHSRNTFKSPFIHEVNVTQIWTFRHENQFHSIHIKTMKLTQWKNMFRLKIE